MFLSFLSIIEYFMIIDDAYINRPFCTNNTISTRRVTIIVQNYEKFLISVQYFLINFINNFINTLKKEKKFK